MDLLHLVDRLEELVATAQKMPIGSRAIVDRRRMLDIVDQMRIAIPEEVREAQEMVDQREELHRRAEDEARLIIARAEQHASRLVESHEITIGARARAEEIARQTEARLQERIEEANGDIQERIADSRQLAEEQMNAADDYARELLQRLARQLTAFVRSVETGIAQLEPAQATPSTGGAAESAVERTHAEYEDDASSDDGDVTTTAAARSEYDDDAAYPRRPEGGADQSERRADLTADSGASAPAPPSPEAVEQLSEAVGAWRQRGTGEVIDDLEYPALDDDPNRGREGAR